MLSTNAEILQREMYTAKKVGKKRLVVLRQDSRNMSDVLFLTGDDDYNSLVPLKKVEQKTLNELVEKGILINHLGSEGFEYFNMPYEKRKELESKYKFTDNQQEVIDSYLNAINMNKTSFLAEMKTSNNKSAPTFLNMVRESGTGYKILSGDLNKRAVNSLIKRGVLFGITESGKIVNEVEATILMNSPSRDTVKGFKFLNLYGQII